MARMLGNNESAFDSARSQFWVVDAKVCSCSYYYWHRAFKWHKRFFIVVIWLNSLICFLDPDLLDCKHFCIHIVSC